MDKEPLTVFGKELLIVWVINTDDVFIIFTGKFFSQYVGRFITGKFFSQYVGRFSLCVGLCVCR